MSIELARLDRSELRNNTIVESPLKFGEIFADFHRKKLLNIYNIGKFYVFKCASITDVYL